MAQIPDAGAIAASWPERAAQFRARVGSAGDLELPYGTSPRTRFDLFRPAAPARGLVVFFHGGYWKAFSKSDWSHLAAGAVASGWAMAIPSYELCPQVRIAQIARQAAAAVSAACRRVGGPVVLTGHSAGGQLVARLAAAHSPLQDEARARLRRVVGISGLYDLRPLLRATQLNAVLQLDAAEAQAESPVLLAPLVGARFTAWVGAGELPEFRRQARLLPALWAGVGAETECVQQPGRHHFDVLDDLEHADGPLTRELLA
jgi:acetyl esterase/lipase